MEKVKDFFDFEKRNGLFDIVDQYGLRPWEAVRYEVLNSVLYNGTIHYPYHKKASIFTRILKTFQRFYFFLVYIYTHRNRNTLFLLCSRDKTSGGQAYDKISDKLYMLASKKNCLTIDTREISAPSSYKYDDAVTDISNLLSKFSFFKYDYSYIYSKIKCEYPDSSITIDIMGNCYNRFISEYKMFKLIFKVCQIKRTFLVQNGIRKGLFAAANEMGVKMIELQHGQISYNHPAYSYPEESRLSGSKIYHPDYLLTFGSFWSQNRTYPGVVDIVIGNDNYSEKLDVEDVAGNKKLIVISNNIEGELLAKRVDEVIEKDPEFFFYFKLHPNQFEEYDYYKKRFKDNCRVKVISNQQSINQLLTVCEGIFLNQSTVELEALRMGKKVFVLTEQNYQSMDFVFGEEGVFTCKDINEFFAKYEQSQNVTLKPREDIFCKFDENVAKEILKI